LFEKTQAVIEWKEIRIFCMEVDFLGHHISGQGIEVNSSKVDKI
jgi:hypothetical protein